MSPLLEGHLALTQCREELSFAYAHAVTAAARCSFERNIVDYYKTDGTIRQRADHRIYDELSLDVQLKCTSQDLTRNTHIAYPLPVEDYNKLSNVRRYNKAILVVLLIPYARERWVTQNEERLKLEKCAYWISLKGWPDPSTSKTKTIHIPRRQVFDAEALLSILQRIGDGGDP